MLSAIKLKVCCALASTARMAVWHSTDHNYVTVYLPQGQKVISLYLQYPLYTMELVRLEHLQISMEVLISIE